MSKQKPNRRKPRAHPAKEQRATKAVHDAEKKAIAGLFDDLAVPKASSAIAPRP